jgi:hypothetical protein
VLHVVQLEMRRLDRGQRVMHGAIRALPLLQLMQQRQPVGTFHLAAARSGQFC